MLSGPAENIDMAFIDHGIAQGIALVKKFQNRLIQHCPLFYAEPFAQAPGGNIAQHHFYRNDIQPFHQHFPVIESFNKMGFDSFVFQELENPA